MSTTLLQCAITGFNGTAVTVYGAVAAGSGMLQISKDGPYTMARRGPRFAFVTNSSASDEREALFGDDDLQDAIGRYFELRARALLVLDNDVSRYNPESAIESDGLDEHGRKYRLAHSMSNGQMAVLALAWYAARQLKVADSLGAFDELLELYGARSVGMPDDDDDF